jgi:hypothetical protein
MTSAGGGLSASRDASARVFSNANPLKRLRASAADLSKKSTTHGFSADDPVSAARFAIGGCSGDVGRRLCACRFGSALESSFAGAARDVSARE